VSILEDIYRRAPLKFFLAGTGVAMLAGLGIGWLLRGCG